MSKNNKFWILLGLTILMSLSGQLFGQVNRILDISPTAYETSVGNQSLIYRNPARNFMTRNDSLSQVTFTRMNWLGHIVSDMTYNYVTTMLQKCLVDFSSCLSRDCENLQNYNI